MKITIKTIPHDQHRYETCGDWRWIEPDHLEISVSEMADYRHSLAIGLHEMVEALLCKNDGVTETEVDSFDLAYAGDGEPGDDPLVPHNSQHQFATCIEALFIHALRLNWAAYEEAVDALEEDNAKE